MMDTSCRLLSQHTSHGRMAVLGVEVVVLIRGQRVHRGIHLVAIALRLSVGRMVGEGGGRRNGGSSVKKG